MKRMPFAIWWAGSRAFSEFLGGVLLAAAFAFMEVRNLPSFWITAPVLGCAAVGSIQLWLIFDLACSRARRLGRSKTRGIDEIVPALWTMTEAVRFAQDVAQVRGSVATWGTVGRHLETLRNEVLQLHATLMNLRGQGPVDAKYLSHLMDSQNDTSEEL